MKTFQSADGETSRAPRASAAREAAARRRVAALAACIAGALAFAPGCGPGDETGEDPPELTGSSSEERAFADGFVAAFCDGLGSCCSTRMRPFDRASCETSVRGLLEARAAMSENVRFDSAAAAQCLRNVRAALPTCAGVEREPCNRIYAGTVATGAPCQRDAECAPVAGSDTYCLQVCKAARRAAAGEACVRTCRSEDDCGLLPGEPPADLMSRTTWGECFTEDGLACVGGTCVRAPGAGAACLANAICDRGFDCTNQTCVALPAIGAACIGDCAPGAYCSLAGVCAAQAAIGAACDDDEACSADASCGRDACGVGSCPRACQSATLGTSHGSAAECGGAVHF